MMQLCQLLFLAICCAGSATGATFREGEASQTLRSSDGRIRGIRNAANKDFVLGGLFPIHSDNTTLHGKCAGDPILDLGLELTEAMLFTLDYINSNDSLLQGLSLGYDIRDSCYSESIGLEETIDLITAENAISSQTCQSIVCQGMTGNMPTVISNLSAAPIIGVVGAASSRVSVPVAGLLRLFDTLQISYASSSNLLSNRDRYEYFYRTIPSDGFQARAMIDILLHFNWTYVSTIYSRNTYGEPGITEFKKLAAQYGICINLDEGIDGDYKPGYFDELASKLLNSTANVVIVFTSHNEAEMILSKISKAPNTRRFIWIASDGWSQAVALVTKYNTTAAGLFGVSPLSEHVERFDTYFSTLTIESDTRNSWFPEVYSSIRKCELSGPISSRTCNRSESFTQINPYAQANLVPLVIDAVYAFALSVHQILQENCDQQDFRWYRNNGSCKGYEFNNLINGSSLLKSIANISQVNPITGNFLSFDENGNVQGKYDIYNYQARGSASEREFYFERVGTWVSSRSDEPTVSALHLNPNKTLQFGITGNDHIITGHIQYEPVESHCGRCSPGHHRILAPSDCCGVCSPCRGQNYSDNPRASRCKTCDSDSWGNDPLRANEYCVPIMESFLRYSNPWSIVVLLVAAIGIVAVVGTSIIFYAFWNTPVIKSSGREQMVALLTGIGMSYALAFVYTAPPSVLICALQRIFLWVCISVMFGALMIKIVRVARFFLRKGAVAIVRPRFTEPHYQVLFTLLIVAVQLLFVIISLVVQHPDVQRIIRRDPNAPDNYPTIILACVPDPLTTLLISVFYESAIIIIATVLGVLSFKYPANFNEAKYISFSTFALLLVWVTFIIAYVVTQQMVELQNVAIAIAMEMSGFSLLLPVFGSKVYIVLFKPNQNTAEGSHRDIHTTTDTKSSPATVVTTDGSAGI